MAAGNVSTTSLTTVLCSRYTQRASSSSPPQRTLSALQSSSSQIAPGLSNSHHPLLRHKASVAVHEEFAQHVERFENEKWCIKDLHIQKTRTAKAYQVITAHERRCAIEEARKIEDAQSPPTKSVSLLTGHCEHCGQYHLQHMNGNGEYMYDPVCPVNRKKVVAIMLIGDSGTGVGSFIRGNERRGGKKLRHNHMRSAIVCITCEYQTSKTCSMCLWRIRLAKAVRTIDGKCRLVTVNGAVECLTKDCPSVQQGHCVKSRDGNAALNIGLAATSALMRGSHKTLFQFSHHLTTLPALVPAATSRSSSSSTNSSVSSTTTSTSNLLTPTLLAITGGGEFQPPLPSRDDPSQMPPEHLRSR